MICDVNFRLHDDHIIVYVLGCLLGLISKKGLILFVATKLGEFHNFIISIANQLEILGFV